IRRKHFEELPADTEVFDMDPFTFGAALTKQGVPLYLAPCARVLCTADETKVNEVSSEWKENFCTLLDAKKRPSSREEFFKAPSGKKNILYIDAEIPRADRGSGGMDALFFMEYMIKRGYHVLFSGENTPCYVPKYTSILQRMGVECFTAGKKQFKEYLRSRGHLFDFVFVSRVYQAQNFDRLIRKYLPQAACIFNTVDLHFLREQREAALKKSQELTLHAFMTEKAELNLMSRADAVILISSEEKRFLASVFGMENCHHIPQARKIYGRTAPPERRSGLLFIGSAHNPNADALKYYVEEILPLLKQRNLPCHLTVIGEELRQDILQQKELAHVAHCPHISWAGFVGDPRELFEEAKVAIAPLRYGAGTKGKVATAMAYGVPCVTSSCGAEGTNMKDGEHLLVRDSASDFARAVEELMNDNALWMKISEGGFAFLKENYAFERVEKQMDEVLSAAQEHHKLQRAIWQELRPGEGLFPRATPTLPPRLFEALRTIQHDRYGSVFCETDQEKIACGEIVSPHFKTGKNIFEEEEHYSYILLSSPFNGTSRETESISCALELLYDGGRLIMPCPGAEVPEETLKKLFFEEPLLLSIAYSPIFNVLCLTKILPERSEIVPE
ncbi:MAG: glycosyltransferase family 4 protein, partial [Lentisphaeria bacterium]|nr:glycosyltransferase family 4 protein [Lentisphaeria bacterium]